MIDDQQAQENMLGYIQRGCKWQKHGAFWTGREMACSSTPGNLHLRVWLDGFMAFSSTVRRHPGHTITLKKTQRSHVLMATESETHGFNFLQNTHGYKNQCRKAIWLTLFEAFLSPEIVRNCWKGLLSSKSHQVEPSPSEAPV